MLQQAIDFRDESAALHALVSPLSEAALDQPTGFKAWTINAIVGHLHMWNWAADLSLRDGEGFQAFFAEIQSHFGEGGTLRSFEERWLDGKSGHALVETWYGFARETADRFAEADPSMRVVWAGPDMSVRSAITARLMETWAHGQAVYDMLGVVRQNADRIRNIVVLGVNTYGWSFKVHGREAPMPPPHVRLTAPSGEVWTYNEPDEANLIEGDAGDFCQVVTQVRNVADTGLRVVGEAAEGWMARAQCFAGPPETPPAPGERFTASRPA